MIALKLPYLQQICGGPFKPSFGLNGPRIFLQGTERKGMPCSVVTGVTPLTHIGGRVPMKIGETQIPASGGRDPAGDNRFAQALS
jgi:hypothetical protein